VVGPSKGGDAEQSLREATRVSTTHLRCMVETASLCFGVYMASTRLPPLQRRAGLTEGGDAELCLRLSAAARAGVCGR
jgi:hypothetical protein